MGGCMRDLLQCCKVFSPAILATIGFILGAVANFVCESITFPVDGGLDLFDGESVVIYAGPWSYRTIRSFDYQNETYLFNVCNGYRYLEKDLGFDYTLDSTSKVVMAFSIITVIIGAIGIVFAYMLPCTSNPRPSKMWTMMGVIFMSTCFFQGLTMLIARSSICLDNPLLQFISSISPTAGTTLPDKCTLDRGFHLNIAATWLWGIAGAFALLVKPPDGSLLTPLTITAGDGDKEGGGDADPENADAGEKKAVAAAAAAAASADAPPDASKKEEKDGPAETAPPAEETKEEPAPAEKIAETESGSPPSADSDAAEEKAAADKVETYQASVAKSFEEEA